MAGAVSELRAKFSASVGDFKKNVSGLREEVSGIGKDTEKGISGANKAFGTFESNLSGLKGAIAKAGAGAGTAFVDLEGAIDKVQQELKDTGSVADSSMKELEAAVMRAEGDLKNLGTDTGLKEMEAAISGVKKDLSTLDGKSLDGVETSAKGAEKEVDKLGETSKTSGKEAEESFNGVETSLLKVGAAAGAATALVGGALFVGAVKVTDDYQKALNGVQAATGATDEETAALSESMKTIYGNNYGESFEHIGTVMTDAKNITGAFGEDLQWLAQDALMLSDTFEYDTQESLRSADKLMKQFGLTGTDAYELIAEGSQKGLDYAQDLLPTIDEYSVYFKNAGYEASDMFGVFENAKNAGVFNLDYAADAFKEFGIIMLEDSDRASDALTGLGLDGAKLREEFAKGGDSAQNAMRTVAGALEGVKDPQKQSILGVELFGTKFEDMGAKAVVEMLQVNDSISGTTDALANIDKIKYNSIGESLVGIKRMIEVEMLEPIQTKVMPMINNLVNSIKENMPAIKKGFSEAFNAISGAVSKFAPTFESLFTIFKNVGGWVGAVLVVAFSSLASILAPITNTVLGMVAAFTSWGAFKPIITGIVAALLAYKTYMFAIVAPMKIMAVLTRGWAIAQGLLNAAMLLNPIGLIIAAIVGLVAAFVIAYKSSDKFRAIVDALWSSIKNGAMAAFNWLMVNIPLLIEGIKNFFVNLGSSIASIWSNITSTVMAAVNAFIALVKAGFSTMVSGIVGFFTSLGGKISAAWSSIIGFVMPIVMSFIEKLKNSFNNAVTNIMNFFSPLITFFKNTWENIKLLVLSIVAAFLNLLTGNFEGFKTSLLGIWTAIKNQVLNIITMIKGMAINIFKALVNMVIKTFNTLKSGIINIVNGIKSGAIAIFNAFVNGVKATITGLKNAAIAIFNGLKSGAIATFNRLKSGIVNIVNGLKSGVINSVNAIKNGIVNGFNNARTMATNAVNGMKTAISNAITKIKTTFSDMKTNILSTLKGISLKDIGKNIIQGLLDGISAKVGAVVDKVKGLAKSITGTITKMMGIKSPSRVFREIGDFLGKGLAIGIEKTRGLVEKTTRALAQSATIEPETVGVGQLTDEQLGDGIPKDDGGSGGAGYNTNYNAPLMHIENYHQNDETDARKISNDLYRLEVDHQRGRGKKTT